MKLPVALIAHITVMSLLRSPLATALSLAFFASTFPGPMTVVIPVSLLY